MSLMIGGPQLEASETLAPRTPPPAAATWYVQYQANDVFFRCTAPAEAVGGRVSKLFEKTLDRATSYPNTDTGLPWSAVFHTEDGPVVARTKTEWRKITRSRLRFEAMDTVFPAHEGAAVWTRPDGRRAILAGFMRDQGILTIAETDDNYFADPKLNLHQRQVGWNEAAIDNICRAMASMDRNVFSTPWLRDRYHREYKKRLTDRDPKTGRRSRRAPLPELFVCGNHVPRQDWPERAEYDGPVRVGFMGSGSHVWDIQQAYKAFHAAKTYWGASTTMIGYNPAAPDREPDELNINGTVYQMRSDKSKRFRDGWAKVVDTHIPWVDPGKYRRAPLPLDIGLAPLVGENDFTMGKSDAKALEYTISGAACVLWRSGIYNSAGWRHGENCLMAGSADEMAECVRVLIHDPSMRYQLVTAAQDMVWNTRNEDNLKREWEAALCP